MDLYRAMLSLDLAGTKRSVLPPTREPCNMAVQATISPQEQQRIVVDALVDFIGRRVVDGEPSMAASTTSS